jgi:hypothetical protein
LGVRRAPQREGWIDSHKRIERVYRLDGLAGPETAAQKLKRPRAPHAPALVPERPLVDGFCA